MFFWFCALLGSGMFIIQFLLSLFGSLHLEIVEDTGLEAGKFKWISRQALAGALMVFGWIGLACEKEFGLSKAVSSQIALVASAFAVFITIFLFRAIRKLHSAGIVFKIEEILGKSAIVYQRLSKDKVGKISVNFEHLTYEIDAISETQEELDSFTLVQIVKKLDENTVIVKPL